MGKNESNSAKTYTTVQSVSAITEFFEQYDCTLKYIGVHYLHKQHG